MNEEQTLTFISKPTLKNPFMVCGFDGWINNGNVSSEGINYFIKQYKAEKFASMPASGYHIYQLPGEMGASPVFRMENGLIVEANLPQNQFFYAKNSSLDHDLILFSGSEPNLHWEEYADNVVNLAVNMGVKRLVTLGGIMEEMPYTREPRMTCTCTSPKIREEMEQYNVLFSNREGPATFNQMLLRACQQKGLDGVGFTVRVPYYPQFSIGLGHSPRSIKAMLVRINHMLHLNLNFDELDTDINALQNKLDSARRQNQQFSSYIEELEKDYVDMAYSEPLDLSPSDAIKFAEDFLKENKDHN